MNSTQFVVRLYSLTFGAVCLLSGLGCRPALVPALESLNRTDQFEIYALEPSDGDRSGPSAFHGFTIVGRANVDDSSSQRTIAEIVDRGVRMGGNQARCFNPRHGIHATGSGRTVDLVICYECSSIVVHENGQSSTLVTGNVQGDLDAAFQSAGLKPSR